MQFSYTVVRKKVLIFEDTKVWLLFFIVTFSILGGFYFLVHLQSTLVNDEINVNKIRIDRLNKEITQTTNQSKSISYKYSFGQNVYSQNDLMKESLKNLFDLIPKQITLTKVSMTQNNLLLSGITRTRDDYRFLLEIPLLSIFEKSEVSFVEMDNGWFRFTSKSHFEASKP